jgi:flagellar basal body-associated protein FliL
MDETNLAVPKVPKKNPKKVLIVVLIAALLLTGAGVAWFVVSSSISDKLNQPTTKEADTQEPPKPLTPAEFPLDNPPEEPPLQSFPIEPDPSEEG